MNDRVFIVKENELRTARTRAGLDCPSALLGIFADGEQLIRLFYRVYQLGRKDAMADLRNLIGE